MVTAGPYRHQLVQQGNGVVVVAETHGLTRLQRVQRTKDGDVSQSFGDASRIEGVNSFRSDVTGGARTHGEPRKLKDAL
jgi:hypothetical protein